MKLIEEKDGKLEFDFFGTAMTIDPRNGEDSIRLLVRMAKVLELRLSKREEQG